MGKHIIKKSTFFLLLIICVVNVHAQKVWVFGQYAGVDFNTPTPTTFVSGIFADEGCASITGENGQLLFYTEGNKVWNRNHVLMTNGNGIVPGNTISTWQSSVIVPMPDNHSKYYIFSLEQSGGANQGGLWYNIVDMSMNSGLGGIDIDNGPVLLDHYLTEKMTVVQGDRCQLWLVVHDWLSAKYKSYAITAAGVDPVPVISNCGPAANYPGYIAGAITFSPSKKMMINAWYAYGCAGLELYDFNPITGQLSNSRMLDTGIAYYAGCFSPDNSKLYAIASYLPAYLVGGVVQYDLSLSNITAIRNSQTLISSLSITGNDVGGSIKLAPNNKIYVSGLNNALHIIEEPNLAGVACNYMHRGYKVTTPHISVRGMFPNETASLPDSKAPVYTKKDTIVCFKDSIILKAIPDGWDYMWGSGSVDSQLAVKNDGIYYVSYMLPPCILHIDTFAVTFFRAPLPVVSNNFTNCNRKQDTVWITPVLGDTATYTYIWTDTVHQVVTINTGNQGNVFYPSYSGIYYLTIKTPGGCEINNTILVPGKVKAVFIGDTAICQRSTATFNASNTRNIQLYHWDFGNNDTASGATQTYIYDIPGRYKVSLIVQDSMLCFDTAHAWIVVDTIPFISLITDKDSFCVGTETSLYAIYRSGIDDLVWNVGVGDIVNNNAKQIISFDQSGTVIIKVTAQYPHCPDTSFTDTLYVWPYPVVDLGKDTELCPGNGFIVLQNLALGDIDNYLWSTREITQTINIQAPGRYWLTVGSKHDCYTTDTVEVRNSCYLHIPNAFTPNGDGINDNFFPRELLSAGVRSFHMQIYNRWGELLFETSKIDGRGWDGTVKGMSVEQGVYIYLIETTYINELQEEYKGNVTLIR